MRDTELLAIAGDCSGWDRPPLPSGPLRRLASALGMATDNAATTWM